MNTNDTRYLNLRRKLDQFKYTQTLHPDSCQLVDKLLKDHLNTLSALDKQRKKSQQTGQKASPSTAMLYDQIDLLTNNNKKLQKQLQIARNSREPDDRTLRLQTHVTQLKSKLESKILEYNSIIQGLQGQVQQSQAENKQLRSQQQKNRSMLDNSNKQLERQNEDLAGLVQRKSKELRQAQEMNSKFRIKIQVLQRNMADLQTNNISSRESSKNQENRMIAILKQEVTEAEVRSRQAKDEANACHEEIQSLRRELRKSKDQLTIMQSQDNRSKSWQQIDKNSREKYEQLIGQSRQEISNKTEEIRKIKQKLQGQQAEKVRLNAKLKQMSNRTKFITDQNNDLQAQIQMVSGKLTLQVKRVRQLQATNASIQQQLKTMRQVSQGKQTENLKRQVQQQSARSQQYKRQIAVKERQIKLLQQQLKMLRVQVEKKTVQGDKINAQNRKLQMIIGQGSKNLQALQLRKEQLMRENSQLKTGKQQLTSADYAAKSQLFVLKEQLQISQVQCQQLRGAVKLAQAQQSKLQDEVRRLQGQLKQNDQKNKQLFQDNKLMVGQIKVLQQRKNQLHQKVKQLQQRQQSSTDQHSVARRQFDQLMAECEELKRTVGRKDQHIRIMDSQRDELQNQLDQQTQNRKQLQDELAALRCQSQKAGRQIDQRQYNLIDLQRQISRLHSQKEDLDRQLHKQCQQNITLRDKLINTQTKNKQLQNQVNLLAISNKQAQRQVQRSRNRMAQLDRRFKDTQRCFQQQRQRATANTILNNQLQQQLQKERAQCMRLTGFMSQFQQANNDMYNKLDQRDRQMQQMNKCIYDMKRSQDQYNRQIDSYQRNVEELTAELEDTRCELRRLGGERQALRAERDWKKDISAHGENNRLRQEERYFVLQQDYQRKRLQNQQLRHRNRQLQAILNQQRAKNFRLSQTSNINKPVMIQSRVVQNYIQNENINYSNASSRVRNMSAPYVRDDLSERSQSQSVQSALEKFRKLQEMYLQTNRI